MTASSRVRRGEIWMTDFGAEPEDPEQAFLRPAVIVSDDRLHHPNLKMAIVVPGTSKMRAIPLHVEVEADQDNGLATDTAFQVEQVRSVSVTRMVERLGRLDSVSQNSLDEVLRTSLSLS